MFVSYLPTPARMQISLATGLAGLLVAASIFPALERFLPPAPVFLYAAVQGAGVAGYICAGLFGWRGFAGVVTASIGAVVVTGLGASIAGTIAIVMMSIGSVVDEISPVPMVVVLGPLALIMGAAEIWPLLTWGGSMVALQWGARMIRDTPHARVSDQFM